MIIINDKQMYATPKNAAKCHPTACTRLTCAHPNTPLHDVYEVVKHVHGYFLSPQNIQMSCYAQRHHHEDIVSFISVERTCHVDLQQSYAYLPNL